MPPLARFVTEWDGGDGAPTDSAERPAGKLSPAPRKRVMTRKWMTKHLPPPVWYRCRPELDSAGHRSAWPLRLVCDPPVSRARPRGDNRGCANEEPTYETDQHEHHVF